MKTWIYIDGTFKDAHAEIELLRGYRDAAEADAALARLLLDKSRLTETEMDAMQTAIDTLHAVQDQTKDPCAKTAIAAGRIMRLRDRLKPIGNVDSDRPEPIDDEITRLRGQLAWTERERDSLRHAIGNLRKMVVAPAETNPTPMRNGTPAEGSVHGEGTKPVPHQTCPHVRGTVTQHCSLNFTLTDEEREAVDEAADTSDVAAEFYSGKDHARADAAAKHAATLRGLLERLK